VATPGGAHLRPRRRNGGTFMGGAFAQLLEGSRFGACPAALATFVPTLIPPEHLQKQAAPANDPARSIDLWGFDSFTHGS
jgi:hypothetical protein